MFIDKGRLLFQLNHLYEQEGVQTVSLYAHPGTGKTRLLKEFAKDKSLLYFKASNVLYEENFRLLKDLCIRKLGKEYEAAKKFSDLFRMLSKASAETPLVLVLDQVSCLLSQNKRFPNLLNSLAKKAEPGTRLFILLCKPGYLYEKEYKKEPSAFLIPTFSFFEMRQFYPDMCLEEQMLLYQITGGNPSYMSRFPSPYHQPKQEKTDFSVKESLCRLFFREDGDFYRMVPNLTRAYYSGSAVMRSILASLGSQKKKLQEVCDSTGLTPSAAGSLLSSLSSHGLVNRIIPVTEDQGSRRTLYEISDGIFRFWYRFVYPYQSEIEMGRGQEIFEQEVLPVLKDCLKPTFETICRDFLALEQEMGTAPFTMEQIGMWWGQHPTKKRTEYVSIAASAPDKILLGTCFWTEEWIDLEALHSLRKHASLFPDTQQWYYLFSKSEFVSGFEVISGSHVKVFTLEQMCHEAENYANNLSQSAFFK